MLFEKHIKLKKKIINRNGLLKMNFYKQLKHVNEIDDGWARKRAITCIKELSKFISLTNLTILVLGCGQGYECEEWKRLKNRIVGADFNKDLLWHAKKNNSVDKIILCDLMEPINQKSESYDIVYCSEVFEHLPKLQPIISEAKRILKNGGYFVITTDNPCGIRNMARMLWQDSRYFEVEGHLHYYSPKRLKKIMEDNGFRVISIKTIGNWVLPSLGDCYMLIAKK